MGGDGNMLNAAALQAIGYTDNAPVLRYGHPVWDEGTIKGRSPSAVFVPVDILTHDGAHGGRCTVLQAHRRKTPESSGPNLERLSRASESHRSGCSQVGGEIGL